jgi:hypothetical protein
MTGNPNCLICGRMLFSPDDPESKDCGGDCLVCMAEAGDPDCIAELNAIRGWFVYPAQKPVGGQRLIVARYERLWFADFFANADGGTWFIDDAFFDVGDTVIWRPEPPLPIGDPE